MTQKTIKNTTYHLVDATTYNESDEHGICYYCAAYDDQHLCDALNDTCKLPGNYTKVWQPIVTNVPEIKPTQTILTKIKSWLKKF